MEEQRQLLLLTHSYSYQGPIDFSLSSPIQINLCLLGWLITFGLVCPPSEFGNSCLKSWTRLTGAGSVRYHVCHLRIFANGLIWSLLWRHLAIARPALGGAWVVPGPGLSLESVGFPTVNWRLVGRALFPFSILLHPCLQSRKLLRGCGSPSLKPVCTFPVPVKGRSDSSNILLVRGCSVHK